MRVRSIAVTGMVFLSFFACAFLFAEQVTVPTAVSKAEAPKESQLEWVPGDVISVDPVKKELGVKYLDYETDQEKTMAVSVDEQTVFENARSLADIKVNDSVSIDYVVTPEGKKIARNLSVEKAEVQQEKPAAAPVTAAAEEGQEEAGQAQEGGSGGADVSESSDANVE